MKKVKIYLPSKTAMQSGKRSTKKWLLEFDTKDTSVNPLTGWESSKDTMSEVKLKFTTKDQAITYAKKNNLEYYISPSNKRKIVRKSYADNFLRNK